MSHPEKTGGFQKLPPQPADGWLFIYNFVLTLNIVIISDFDIL